MKETKDEVKKIVRSLLLSAPHGLTVNELCSEYTSITCKPLPYKDLGYNSAADFVKDFPDVIRPVFRSGGALLLQGVPDSSTAHINELVRRQRSSKRTNSRIITYQEPPKSTKSIVPNFIRSKILDVIKSYHKGIEIKLFEKAYQTRYGKRLQYQLVGFDSMRSLLNSCQDIVSVKVILGEIFVSPIPGISGSSTVSRNINQHVEKPKLKPNIGISEVLKQEIHTVLKRRKNGVWSARFPFEYQDYHKKSFDIQDLGFNSVVELMAKIPYFVIIERPVKNGDWILIAKEIEEQIEDTRHLRYALSDINELEQLIEIYLSYVIDPSAFWFQCSCKMDELDALMADMYNFYHQPEGDQYMIKKEFIQFNQPCCALFEDDQWYRAVVTKRVSDDKVQVFYVDYGNEMEIPVSSLRTIKKKYMTLPCQAIKAQLNEIHPDNDGKSWSTEIKQKFYDITTDRYLYARVIKTNPLVLQLIDTNGDKDINIADCLITKKQEKNQTSLQPTPAVEEDDSRKNLRNYYQEYYKALQQVSIIAKQEPNISSVITTMQSSSLKDELHSKEILDEKPSIADTEFSVKSMKIGENSALHIIRYNGQPYVTSAEISQLYWKGDILRQMLQQKNVQVPKELILRDDNEKLFQVLLKTGVKGVMNSGNELRPFITVYHLKCVPRIMTLFSTNADLINQIETELNKWENEKDFFWVAQIIPDDQEKLRLKMQGLKFKRKRLFLTMMANCAPKSTVQDLQDIEKEISELEKIV